MKGRGRVEVDGVSYEVDNTVCNNGLVTLSTYLAQFGSSAISSPIYGAVGTGSPTPPAVTFPATDTQLVTEVGRARIGQGGSSSTSFTWSTVITNLSGLPWTITEGGIFLDASNIENTGSMLNHFAFNVAITVASNSMISLSGTFTL